MKRSIMTVLILSLLFLTAGCGSSSDSPGQEEMEQTLIRVSYDDLPQEVKVWVDGARGSFRAQDKVFGSRRYLLVTYGAKPTSGFTVEIKDIETSGNKLYVTVKFTQPTRDQYVTPGITRPYDIVFIKDSQLPLKFFPVGDEFEIPSDWVE